MKSAKKPDCENTDTFFKTIELVNDSLVSEASPTEKSGIGDTKQTKVKSPLVQYPIDSIPSYEGSIGSSTTVSLTRACVSCIPDATAFLSDEDGKGVLSTEKQRMSTTKQKETHTPKLQGISTLSHTTSSSSPLDVLLPFPSHVAGRRVVARLRPLSHLPVDSLPPTQSRPPSSRRAAQPCSLPPTQHRAKLLDWLAEVSHEFHVRTETSVLAVRFPAISHPVSPRRQVPGNAGTPAGPAAVSRRRRAPACRQILRRHTSLAGKCGFGGSFIQRCRRCRCAASRCSSLSTWKWSCSGSFTSTCVSSPRSTSFSPNSPLFPSRRSCCSVRL